MKSTFTLRQLIVFMTLVAVCLGLSVAKNQYHLAVLAWFLPGAYLAMSLQSRGQSRLARRALPIGRRAALGGAISCVLGVAPIQFLFYLNYYGWLDLGRLRENLLRWETIAVVVLNIAGACLLGAVEGFLLGWLWAKIVADQQRQRRWLARRRRYGDPADRASANGSPPHQPV